MKSAILFFILVTSAFGAKNRIYHISSLSILFEEKDGFYINASCLEKKCEALEKATSFKSQEVPSNLLLGGKNPSAVKCTHLLKGKVVIATDDEGHQQSLCHFSDDSYLQN